MDKALDAIMELVRLEIDKALEAKGQVTIHQHGPFVSEDALRKFVRDEVRKALKEATLTRGWEPYTPKNAEVK